MLVMTISLVSAFSLCFAYLFGRVAYAALVPNASERSKEVADSDELKPLVTGSAGATSTTQAQGRTVFSTLVCACAVLISTYGIASALLNSFFATEAPKRHVTPYWTGVIMAAPGAGDLGFSLLGTAQTIDHLGNRRALICAVVAQIAFLIAMGVLGYPHGMSPTLYSISLTALRVLGGCAGSVVSTSARSMIWRAIPHERRMVASQITTGARGFHLVVGPFFAGSLYRWFGYGGPFFGLAALISIVLMVLVASPVPEGADLKPAAAPAAKQHGEESSGASMKRLGLVETLFTGCNLTLQMALFTANLNNTVLSSSMYLHVSSAPFHLDSLHYGLFECGAASTYLLTTMATSALVRVHGRTQLFVLAGIFTLGAAFFYGPSPLVSALILARVDVMFFGVGLAYLGYAFYSVQLTVVTVDHLAYCGYEKGRILESIMIIGQINGAAGKMLGNYLGTVGSDRIGFPWTSTLAAAGASIMTLAIPVFVRTSSSPSLIVKES